MSSVKADKYENENKNENENEDESGDTSGIDSTSKWQYNTTPIPIIPAAKYTPSPLTIPYHTISYQQCDYPYSIEYFSSLAPRRV